MKLLAVSVPDMDMNALRGLGDEMKEKLGDGDCVFRSQEGVDGSSSKLTIVGSIVGSG